MQPSAALSSSILKGLWVKIDTYRSSNLYLTVKLDRESVLGEMFFSSPKLTELYLPYFNLKGCTVLHPDYLCCISSGYSKLGDEKMLEFLQSLTNAGETFSYRRDLSYTLGNIIYNATQYTSDDIDGETIGAILADVLDVDELREKIIKILTESFEESPNLQVEDAEKRFRDLDRKMQEICWEDERYTYKDAEYRVIAETLVSPKSRDTLLRMIEIVSG